MRPVLRLGRDREVRISDAVDLLANQLRLDDDDRNTLLPSGKQTAFANRVHWAKSYLLQAGLVEAMRRGHYRATDRGIEALDNGRDRIDKNWLERFPEFQEFRDRARGVDPEAPVSAGAAATIDDSDTPDVVLRRAYNQINAAVAGDLLSRVRLATPKFFENLIVKLLLAMGYGGTSQDAGRALGQSGDDGIDGVIDQDVLGVDQIYLQAKRYAEGNAIGPGAIRDFYGALSLKKAAKGIFVTTSGFSPAATQTARDLGARIVLIDGVQLATLMIRYNVGCRDEQILHLKRVDDAYFEED